MPFNAGVFQTEALYRSAVEDPRMPVPSELWIQLYLGKYDCPVVKGLKKLGSGEVIVFEKIDWPSEDMLPRKKQKINNGFRVKNLFIRILFIK